MTKTRITVTEKERELVELYRAGKSILMNCELIDVSVDASTERFRISPYKPVDGFNAPDQRRYGYFAERTVNPNAGWPTFDMDRSGVYVPLVYQGAQQEETDGE